MTIASTGSAAADVRAWRAGRDPFPLLQAKINRYDNASKDKETLRILIFFPMIESQFLTIKLFHHFFTINGVWMSVVC